MITEEKVYSIKCDECGDFFCCQSKEDAEYFADLEGWIIKDEKYICPDCYFKRKINEEEE